MTTQRSILFTAIVLIVTITCACAIYGGNKEASQEESGVQFSLNESYDAVRNGARLVLTYNANTNSFTGFVENSTGYTLKQVRVEVHLSNGVELGPTTPTDLKPGERTEVSLAAPEGEFSSWSAHPEVGVGEHGHSEDEGEHGVGGERGHDESDGEHSECGHKEGGSD